MEGGSGCWEPDRGGAHRRDGGFCKHEQRPSDAIPERPSAMPSFASHLRIVSRKLGFWGPGMAPACSAFHKLFVRWWARSDLSCWISHKSNTKVVLICFEAKLGRKAKMGNVSLPNPRDLLRAGQPEACSESSKVNHGTAARSGAARAKGRGPGACSQAQASLILRQATTAEAHRR